MSEVDLLVQLAQRLPAPAQRCVRVAVDGVDGVGKSTFAARLAATLRTGAREVVQVSADGFHQPRRVRHRRGRACPKGFWLDSYDYQALRDNVLAPFGPDGSRRYRPAVHDLVTDQPLDLAWRSAAPGAVLIVDGLFLHRDELVGTWDFSVYLHAAFDVTVARMAHRDGTPADPDHPDLRRYVEGQRLYFAACTPWRRATVVIDHTDLAHPAIIAATTMPEGSPGPAR